MKIKMLMHYHGRLSNDKHLNVGEVHDLEDAAAKELVKGGYAEPVGSKPDTKSKATK